MRPLPAIVRVWYPDAIVLRRLADFHCSGCGHLVAFVIKADDETAVFRPGRVLRPHRQSASGVPTGSTLTPDLRLVGPLGDERPDWLVKCGVHGVGTISIEVLADAAKEGDRQRRVVHRTVAIDDDIHHPAKRRR